MSYLLIIFLILIFLILVLSSKKEGFFQENENVNVVGSYHPCKGLSTLKNIIDSVRDIVEYNHNLLVSNAKNRSSLTLLYVHGKIEDILNEWYY